MKKKFKKIPALIFVLLHFTFLIAAMFENRFRPIPFFILSIITLLLGNFYFRKLNFRIAVFRKLDLLLVPITALGAVATYAIDIQTGFGAVLAAGIIGLISSFLPFINRKSEILRELPVAIYCGAFVGMTSPLVANGYSFILASGLLAGIILISTKTTLHGYGGKLGTIAFGGVSMVSFILFLFF